MTDSKPITDFDRIIENCACSYCGNNCDDITYLIKDNHIVGVRNACRIGASKVISDQDQRLKNPMIRNKEGILEEVSWTKAIDETVKVLKESMRPVMYGWGETSVEAIKEGLKIAMKIGAVIDNQSTICHGSTIQAFQNIGHPVLTLGETKNRADMIIYAGTNPMEDHPRHMTRYTAFPEGLFRPNGRKDRFVMTWDPRYSNTAKCSDKWVKYNHDEDYAFLTALRMAVNNHKLNKKVIAGISAEEIYKIADQMKNVECGSLYFGLGLTQTLAKQRNIDILIQLVQDLNKYTKWAMLPMRGFFNVNGFNMIMTSITGYPYGVDFARGYPRYMIGETTTIDLLNRKEPDVFMAVSTDPGIQFPGQTLKHLIDIPVIQIDTHWGPLTELADIVIPSTRIGVETCGTSYRMDSVPIYMKKIIDKPENCKSDEEIFNMILNKLGGKN
ncbi:MAG: formylmethanofuran dehydrogenase subunit B [Methanobacteriaceae archaeon]|nr:formylmethanofuran dehydrogenase subunit B [Methanobacteriaceae archaeon]